MKKLFLALSLLSIVSLSARGGNWGGHGGGWGRGGNWGGRGYGRDVAIGTGVALGAAALSDYDGYDSGYYDSYPVYSDSDSDDTGSMYNSYAYEDNY